MNENIDAEINAETDIEINVETDVKINIEINIEINAKINFNAFDIYINISINYDKTIDDKMIKYVNVFI